MERFTDLSKQGTDTRQLIIKDRWDLLEKQLGNFSSRSPENRLMQNGITILTMVAVFLVGMGVGDIVSKTKQANTHYAALISYPGQE